MSMRKEYELAIVMPVFNEEECIVEVVNSWISMLRESQINFLLLVFNDGSTDSTESCLETFREDQDVEVIAKPNSGHGPTVSQGYHQAVRIADWVFQCDSDDEMSPDYFPILWKRRDSYDALFGIRTDRSQNFSRRLISLCSRTTVNIVYGSGITDVNSPYRLIRGEILEMIIRQLPEDTVAPNVIVSGVLARQSRLVYEHPVPYRARRTGSVSIVSWTLWKLALKAFQQALFSRRYS